MGFRSLQVIWGLGASHIQGAAQEQSKKAVAERQFDGTKL